MLALRTTTAGGGSGAHSASADSDAPQLAVRVALSRNAAKRFNARRLRRLLRLELDDALPIEAGPGGPLGVELIRVWVDVPSPRRAVIEVRRTGRPLARRAVAISGFKADVAARVAVIAAGEMVRVQAAAKPRDRFRQPAPQVPGPASEADRDGPFALGASAVGLFLPTSDTVAFVGPELSLEHRSAYTGQTLFTRWLLGPDSGAGVGWFELGAGIEVRADWPSRNWRIRFAARAAAVALSLPDAERVNGIASPPYSWTARGGGLIGTELMITKDVYLGLSLEPGATVHTLTIDRSSGATEDLGGFNLGTMLSLIVDPRAADPASQQR